MGRIGFALAVACLCVGLLVWALPGVSQGAGLEHTDIAWDSLLQGPRMSRDAYVGAERYLGNVAPGDGATLVRKAAFTALGPGDVKRAAVLAREAVEDAPADPQAWTLLCEILSEIDVRRAARCLDTALIVAPFDAYVSGRRAFLAANLWPVLGDDTREAAARETRRIWSSDVLRVQLWELMRRPRGPELVVYALHYDSQSLRAFNKWYFNMELCGGTCSPKAD